VGVVVGDHHNSPTYLYAGELDGHFVIAVVMRTGWNERKVHEKSGRVAVHVLCFALLCFALLCLLACLFIIVFLG
jgi:hypothetical protein